MVVIIHYDVPALSDSASGGPSKLAYVFFLQAHHFFQHFFTFWLRRLILFILYLSCRNSQVSYFSKKSWFFLVGSMCRETEIQALGVLAATGVSLL